VELGKMLYFDPRLSASHAISCNSCHNVGLGGADGESTSIGHRWQRGGRNAPTVFNAVFDETQFWDGRAKDLEQQAGGPIVNPVEMGSPEAHVAEQLSAIPGYREAFAKAFPAEADPVTLGNVQKAIAVFEATLITPDARFRVTRTPGDEFVFKVPSLRNVALTAPYFHTGQVWDLTVAVEVMGASQLGAHLTADEVSEITAFLESLTGIQPRVTYPILPPSIASTPRPQP
jgi:cytochrome c peroxidase